MVASLDEILAHLMVKRILRISDLVGSTFSYFKLAEIKSWLGQNRISSLIKQERRMLGEGVSQTDTDTIPILLF